MPLPMLFLSDEQFHELVDKSRVSFNEEIHFVEFARVCRVRLSTLLTQRYDLVSLL